MLHRSIVFCLVGLLGAASGLACRTAPPPARRAARAPATPPANPPNKLSSRDALRLVRAENDPFWRNAHEADYKSVREVLAQHEKELERGLKFAQLLHGDPRQKRIALTFDDGPHPAYTPKLLQILAQHRVPATFFVVGEQAEKHPELVRQAAAQGHTIGNHTYHHVSLPKIPLEYVADEIKACGEVIQAATGTFPHWFRPPGGEYNRHIAEIAEALGYTMALWTDDPGDHAFPGEDVLYDRTTARATNGGIILLHDGVDQTLRALPRLIEALRKRGFAFVSLDTLHRDLPGHRAR